jgi:ATP-dependent protease ClpP protease subunit
MRTYGDIMEMSMQRYVELLAEYSMMPKRHWSNLIRSRTDRYFTAEEAEDYGLIDHVV